MNLLQEINDRVSEDPESAKAFFNLKKKPDAKWFDKIEPGVSAAQCIVDEHSKDKTPPPAEDITGAEAFGLGMEKEPETTAPPVAQPSLVSDDLLAQLRARLRVPGDADMQTCIQAVLAGAWSRRVVMLTPLALPILPAAHFAHMAQLRTQPWMGFHQEQNTIIQVARNQCAHAFLRSEAEWSFWVDGDIIPSWGDASFFYDPKRLGVEQSRIPVEFLKTKALDRLMKHGKTIVGAVYQQRRKGGAICSPIDLRPNPSQTEKEIAAQIRKGPRDAIAKVEWCATGCLLVHRSVYDDIKRRFPERAPKNEDGAWDFFGHDVARMGEDAAFGLAAKEAGHQSYLDLGCWVGHIGNFCFTP